MTDTVLILILTGAGTAITTLAGLLWRERNARAEAETALAVANATLSGYEQATPDLVRKVNELLDALHGEAEPPLASRPAPRARATRRRREGSS